MLTSKAVAAFGASDDGKLRVWCWPRLGCPSTVLGHQGDLAVPEFKNVLAEMPHKSPAVSTVFCRMCWM
jgi:hypothetical protein